MKIAIIGLRGLGDGLGGVEKVVTETSTRLVNQGIDLTCFCKESYSQNDLYSNVKLINIKTLNTKHGETGLYALKAIIKASRSDFNILHLHALASSFLSWIPKLYGKNVITTIHGLDWQRAKWGYIARSILKIGEAFAVTFSDAIICVSLSLYTYFKMRYPRKRIIYIPNGCDLPDENEYAPPAGLNKDGYILYMGRLVPEKGAHKLISAFNALNTDCKLVIAGGGTFSSKYEQQLKEMASHNPNIIFPGIITGESKEQYLRNALAFVLPSEIEGLPIALLESSCRGICPIVSAIPTTVEILGDWTISRGYTFDPYSLKQLRTALETCISNPQLTKELGQRARERVRSLYNWDLISSSIHEIYNDITSTSGE